MNKYSRFDVYKRISRTNWVSSPRAPLGERAPLASFSISGDLSQFYGPNKVITTKIKIKANKRTLEQVSRRNKGTEGSREITWVLDEANFMLGVRSGTRLAKGGLEPK